MKNTIIKISAVMAIAFALLLIACGDDPIRPVDRNDFYASEDFLFEIDIAGQTSLSLENINGSITIIGRADFDSVIISGTKRVGSESEQDAEEHLQYIEIDVQERANEIYVKTIQPQETHGRTYEADYEIIMPRDFSAVIANVNGTVIIDSVNSGMVVSNVNGQVILDEINAGATASLVNGLIIADIVLPHDATVTLSNVNGGIELSIPDNTSAEFSAEVVNGGISINNLDLQNEQITNHSVRGILGNGDGVIALSTVNGNIIANGY